MYLQGCRAPLVVKFADTQKDKEMKKLQQMNANLLSVASLAGLGNISPQYLAVSIHLHIVFNSSTKTTVIKENVN